MAFCQQARENITMLSFTLIVCYIGAHHYISYPQRFAMKENWTSFFLCVFLLEEEKLVQCKTVSLS